MVGSCLEPLPTLQTPAPLKQASKTPPLLRHVPSSCPPAGRRRNSPGPCASARDPLPIALRTDALPTTSHALFPGPTHTASDRDHLPRSSLPISSARLLLTRPNRRSPDSAPIPPFPAFLPPASAQRPGPSAHRLESPLRCPEASGVHSPLGFTLQPLTAEQQRASDPLLEPRTLLPPQARHPTSCPFLRYPSDPACAFHSPDALGRSPISPRYLCSLPANTCLPAHLQPGRLPARGSGIPAHSLAGESVPGKIANEESRAEALDPRHAPTNARPRRDSSAPHHTASPRGKPRPGPSQPHPARLLPGPPAAALPKRSSAPFWRSSLPTSPSGPDPECEPVAWVRAQKRGAHGLGLRF